MALWGLDILVLVILIILLFVFISLPLYITARILVEDEGLLVAFGTTILLLISFSACTSVFSWFGLGLLGLVIAVIVNLFIIKIIYDTDWGEAFIMWIITIIMLVVIIIIAGIFIGVGMFLLL